MLRDILNYSLKVLDDSIPITTISGGREISFKCVKCSKKIKIKSTRLIIGDVWWRVVFFVFSIIGIEIIWITISHSGIIGLIKSLPKDLNGCRHYFYWDLSFL